jgi:glycosyltransferase involved in cell wall biosynthesis
MKSIHVAIQQRILAFYRIPFFKKLAEIPNLSIHIHTGLPANYESINALDYSELPYISFGRTSHYFKGSFYFCYQNEVHRWIKTLNPDVCVIDNNPRIISNRSIIHYAKKCGSPIIGWGLGVLGTPIPFLPNTLRSKLFASHVDNHDAFIGYSSKAREDFLSLGADPDSIFIAPNSAADDVSENHRQKLIENPQMVAQWKQKNNLDPLKTTLLFVGRLIPEKMLTALIDAAAQLANSVNLIIVGDGHDRTLLEQSALKVFPRTVFLGHQTGEELALCFAASDIFVLPGAGGLAIQEAMSFNLPIIAAHADGSQKDLIIEGINGFIVPANNPEKLAQMIQPLIQTPAMRIEMGRQSRQIIEKRYNLTLMADAFIAAIKYVLIKQNNPKAELLQSR